MRSPIEKSSKKVVRDGERAAAAAQNRVVVPALVATAFALNAAGVKLPEISDGPKPPGYEKAASEKAASKKAFIDASVERARLLTEQSGRVAK